MKILIFFWNAAAFWLIVGVSASYAQITEHDHLVSWSYSGGFEIEGSEKIDSETAHKLFIDGVSFIDVRGPTSYLQGHIPGAIHLHSRSQLTEASLAKHVAKDQAVVFYCSYPTCKYSVEATSMAVYWGYTDVYYFAEGWSGWTSMGYETE
jgi:rhodanese-related sulfurtransferase